MKGYEEFEKNIHQGYYFYLSNELIEATKHWHDAWIIFLNIADKEKFKTLKDCGKIFNSSDIISDWLGDFEMELKKCSDQRQEYHKVFVDFCEEYLSRFDDGSKDPTLRSIRANCARSTFILEKIEKAEEMFVKYLKLDPSWTKGWMAWAECRKEYADGSKSDLNKAVSILNKALTQKLDEGKTQVLKMLCELYTKLKQPAKVEEVKAKIIEVWGLE